MKNKCENEDDLDLHLNGPNFTRNRIKAITHQKVYLSAHEV